MGRPLPKSSEDKLSGVNYRLADFIRQLSVECAYPFIVTEGLRTKARQRELFKNGATKTLNSRHLVGRAVDIAPIVGGAKVSWEWKDFTPIIECARALAPRFGIELVFGYDWGWDAPHIEMKER